MSLLVDPIASLRPFPLAVTLAGREYVIRERSAADWLMILLEDPVELSSIIPGMLSEKEAATVDADLWAGRLSADEIHEAALEVIAAAAGRPWWWTVNIVTAAATAWPIVHGRLVARGVDARSISLAAFLDALYLTWVEVMDSDGRKTFDRVLQTAPAQEQEPINEEQEGQAFLAMMNSGQKF